MKILVLYASGLSGRNKLAPDEITRKLRGYDELGLIAELDVTAVNSPRLNIGTPSREVPDVAKQISAHINEQYDRYEGFVVIHSIDNAAYTANLVALQLTNLGKPVVFTSATVQEDAFPLLEELDGRERQMYYEMSVRTNLVTAVRLATMNISQVLLAYGSKIVQATRAVEITHGDRPFMTWKNPDVGTVRYAVELDETAPPRSDSKPKLLPCTKTVNLLTLSRQPALHIPKDAGAYTAALILGYREPPMELLHSLSEQLPVYCATNRRKGTLVTKNLFLLPAMTATASFAKVYIGLARADSPEARLDWFNSNIAGELANL